MGVAKVITFGSRKGGTGKTTLAYNVSSYLSDNGYKCLLVDLDSQAHATIHSGFDPLKISKGIYEMIISYLNSSDFMDYYEYVVNSRNLALIPSNEKIAALEVELSSIKNKESVLKDVLVEFDSMYDFIVIDTPPSLGMIVINALVASDYLIIPVKLDFFSLVGLAQMMNFYYRINSTLAPSLKFLGLAPIRPTAKAKVSDEVLEELKRTFGEELILPILRNDVKVVEAASHGMPVYNYAPRCRASQDIEHIAEEILRRAKS